jgi:hypothetical protein
MNGDLARYRHGEIELVPFKNRPDAQVNQLLVDADGAVFGATASGLVGWKEGKQQTLTVRNGLPCDGINALVADRQGSLWLYMQCGLVQIAGPELQRWWGLPDGRVQLRTYDAFDGVSPGFTAFQGAARSPDGRLWFANSGVLQMLDPAHLAANVVLPPVHVEQVVADRTSYAPRDDLRLPPLTRDIEIDYTALSFVVPQKVHFRYKLEGHDSAEKEAVSHAGARGRLRSGVSASTRRGDLRAGPHSTWPQPAPQRRGGVMPYYLPIVGRSNVGMMTRHRSGRTDA